MIENLIKTPPYSLPSAEKAQRLLEAMHEAYRHHVDNCAAYARFCAGRGLNRDSEFKSLADFPYLPVQAFKDSADLLRSVPEDQIKTKLQSSATSGMPSTTPIDGVTAKRQVRALAGVLGAALGPKRRPLIVFDADPRSGRGIMGARSAAVQGFLNLAREVHYAMSPQEGVLTLQRKVLADLSKSWSSSSEPVLLFGFTYLIYSMALEPLAKEGIRLPLPAGSKLAHLGGWKKLADRAVSKEEFARCAELVFGISPENVVDFYGFTEQMGVTYPDAPSGDKMVPAFAEVIVRDPKTLEPCADGEVGLLQFLTPLPYSYPGISVLTDDIGVITSRDDSGDWHGARFRVLGRAKNAEVRGCGDILGDKVAAAQARSSAREQDMRLLFSFDHAPASQGRWDAPLSMESLPQVDSVTQLVERLKKGRKRLDHYSVDDLIAIISAAARRWAEPDSELRELRQQGLLFLSSWCRPERLARLADESLRGRRGYLDGPLPIAGSRVRHLGARQRGLVVHWLAGNVPVLGMLTLVQSILARNANLIKAASRFTRVLPMLLDAFRGLKVVTPGGRELLGDDILASIAVVYFDREDSISAQAISSAADVRLAWGGREAIESVATLPRKVTAEDILFGPKLSFMVIGQSAFDKERKIKRLARRAATDVCVFEQTGCASPHTIFIERGENLSAEDFAVLLAAELDKALVRFPPPPISPDDASRVEARRIRGELTGRVWRSKGTAWTVILDDAGAELASPCYGRVITIREVDRIDEILPLVHDGIQTIGLALEGEPRLHFVQCASRRGAERFPDIGRMTLFEAPWDGLFPLERLVKWYTLGGPV
ncbi:acyl-CoA reductase [Cerasicoccus fimbriatus]|uniref:LuxE/PaaK family acyltransferase n=1 Tax=Cerasicoccus fimbriatus TaxID=3014554 RepID=UPI0022B30968|nr:acyl-CoA reductase [Cerasicoccus sp. TK19100]